jgi:hypothetical protein
MTKCFEVVRCSKCREEAEIWCGDCLDWHCVSCYSREIDEIGS